MAADEIRVAVRVATAACSSFFRDDQSLHQIRGETGCSRRCVTGVTLSADVYRPDGADGPMPTILICTPYGKRGGYWNANCSVMRTGIDASDLSGLKVFEAVDPG
ncbi:CocE/NonD family hydrolase [Agromyces sp. NPDC058484]|uniref:CocE/NonD family hydrolase n=1 Tax=Agromyces sp. NPDC058484 TaxID=3346524 RepID=UPI003655E75F